MDILVRLTVPNDIYRFYRDASQYIADATPETVMSDALTNYAAILSHTIPAKNIPEDDQTHL